MKQKRMHVRGPAQSEADFIIHVCFDDHFGSPRMFIYWRYIAAELVAAAQKEKLQPTSGSREGQERETGEGYLFTPDELHSWVIPFVPNPKYAGQKLGLRAENEAWRWMAPRGEVLPAWSKEEQLRGFDLYFTLWADVENGITRKEKIEVKSRGSDKRFPKLFIQCGERNPKKRKS